MRGVSLPAVKSRVHRSRLFLRQRLAQLHVVAEILRLIRLRSVTAAIKGEPPGHAQRSCLIGMRLAH